MRLVVEVRVPDAPAAGVRAVAPAPAPADDGSGWRLAGGGAFQDGGRASLDVRLEWQWASGARFGAWVTYGHTFTDETFSATTFGVAAGKSARLGAVRLDWGGFGGFNLVPEHAEDGDVVVGGIGGLLAGGRLGLAVPVATGWCVRAEVSAAGVLGYQGRGIWTWASLLVEKRL
jgi:hypothetical protein